MTFRVFAAHSGKDGGQVILFAMELKTKDTQQQQQLLAVLLKLIIPNFRKQIKSISIISYEFLLPIPLCEILSPECS